MSFHPIPPDKWEAMSFCVGVGTLAAIVAGPWWGCAWSGSFIAAAILLRGKF